MKRKPIKKSKARKPRESSAAQVAARRKTQQVNRRVQTQQSQDIGEIPAVKNPDRRAAALERLDIFGETYFQPIFYLPWSKDHRRVIAAIERVIIHHDSQAIAMPRGSGKSRLSELAVLWAKLKGLHRFTVLIAATGPKSADSILWFKKALTENDLLFQDFPEVCYPLRLLENEARRCLGQHHRGKQTNIVWGRNRIILPTISGSPASGGIIHAVGIGGNVRGLNMPMPDGSVARPTLAMVDDPQTPASARSQGPAGQTTKRLQVITQDIQGLAGPNSQVGVMVPCTVICPNDLADQLLNRKLHPDYHGERTKRFYSWPTNMMLWEKYRELREVAMQTGQPLGESIDFYRARMCDQGRKLDEPGDCAGCQNKTNCMDCGAVVDWAARLDDPRNLSAVQAAMHSLYKYGPAGFAAEFQNEPLLGDGTGQRLTAELCRSRVSGHPRLSIPVGCTELTMGVDVQQWSLWYVIVAWQPDGTGHVVDYSAWPRQSRPIYTKAEIASSMNNLQTNYPNCGIEGAIQAGLDEFISRSLARNFERSGGGGLMKLGCILVDSGKWDKLVAAVKMKTGGDTMKLSKGIGIRAGTAPMAHRSRKPGEKWDSLGWWYIPVTQGTKEFPALLLDTNHFKSVVHRGFLTAPGDPGALTLFGGDPNVHDLFAGHICAERWEATFGHGREVEEFTIRPERPDNEWLDSMVYATAAASYRGIGQQMRQGVRKVVSVAARMAARSA